MEPQTRIFGVNSLRKRSVFTPRTFTLNYAQLEQKSIHFSLVSEALDCEIFRPTFTGLCFTDDALEIHFKWASKKERTISFGASKKGRVDNRCGPLCESAQGDSFTMI